MADFSTQHRVTRISRMGRPRRRTVTITVVVAVFVLSIFAVWAVWFSPIFSARTVQVTGAESISSDQVIQAAQVPLGAPLIRIDTSAIESRVARIPAVADVSIDRHANGVVEVLITQRTPVYVLIESGQFTLVDAHGVAYQAVGEPPVGMVTVSISGGEEGRMRADAAAIVDSLPEDVRALSPVVTAASPDGFTIALASGAQVMWGSADESDLKAEVITALIKIPASYYDVSAPSHPATR